MLLGNKGKMALIPAIEGDFAFRPGKHACRQIDAISDFYWIPYFGTVLKAKSNKTVIGTVILPVDDESEAGEITRSIKRTVDSAGNFILSFVKEGKEYVYTFQKGSEGLVLTE